jgi:hypothetical protein
MLHQYRFNLDRRHILAAGLKHIVAAASVSEITFGMVYVFIAALQPFPLEG